MLLPLCPRHRHRFLAQVVRSLATAAAGDNAPSPPATGSSGSSTASFKRQTAEVLLKKHRLMRLGSDAGLSHVAGHRSYVLLGDAARLERALLTWTLKQLVQEHGFTPVCVPNLLFDDVVAACGFDPHGPRTQVYSIAGRFTGPDMRHGVVPDESGDQKMRTVCLSGTSEVPLVGLHMGKTFEVDSEYESEHLPKRYCAVSRCYRAETSNVEKGLFRVHYFNKVEMLALVRSDDDASANMLQHFVSIQKQLFSQLGLEFEARDMPAADLGPAAVHKVDIEAAFPGRGIVGEISSASDCRDRQCKNLNIRYRRLATDAELQRMQAHEMEPFVTDWVHSVNGTACATPRTLLPIIESHQTPDGRIRVPDVLRHAFGGQEFLQPLPK